MKTQSLLWAVLLVVTFGCGVPVKEGAPDIEQTKAGLGQPCGGLAGFACAEGLACVDVANDGCDPANGGADCIGQCVLEPLQSGDGGSRDVDGGDADAGDGGWHGDGGHNDGGWHGDGGHNDGGWHGDGGHNDGGWHGDGGYNDGGDEDGGAAPSDGGLPDGSEGAFCGGVAGFTCAFGLVCVDVSDDSCDLESGADCGGTCQRPAHGGEGSFCGGIGNIPCGPELSCIDDPNDGCDPSQGDADCGGTCQPNAP